MVACRLRGVIQEFRVRPAQWRLALAGSGAMILAAWLTTVTVLTVQTLVGPQRLPVIAAGALLLALLIGWLWPSGPSLASRMGVYQGAAAVATFGAIRLVERDLDLAVLLAFPAMAIAFAAYRRQASLLRNVYENRFLVRVAIFATAVLPGALVIAVTGLRIWEYPLIWSAVAVAGAAFLAFLLPPPTRFEQLTRIELREPVAPLLLALTAVAALTAAWPDLLRYGIPVHRLVSIG